MEEFVMSASVRYESEIKIVPFGDGKILVENLTPQLSQKEREKRKREIENRLYNVFSKYEDMICKA